jgi:hypothetical protein
VPFMPLNVLKRASFDPSQCTLFVRQAERIERNSADAHRFNSHFGMPFVDVSQRLGGQRRNLSGRSFIRRRWAARDYAEPKERNQLTSHRNQFSAQCFTWNQTEFQVWGADQNFALRPLPGSQSLNGRSGVSRSRIRRLEGELKRRFGLALRPSPCPKVFDGCGEKARAARRVAFRLAQLSDAQIAASCTRRNPLSA